MQRLAHETYLIGQLSKLAQVSELNAYLKSNDRGPLAPGFWEILGCAPDIGQTKRFGEAQFTEDFLRGLSEASVATLTEILSTHHNNGVFKCISKAPRWECKIFRMEGVEVGDAETELKEAFGRNQRRLLLVAAEPSVLQHPHYRDRNLKNAVPYDVFLGKWESGRPRLVDGNHRAIHMARQFLGGFRDDEVAIVVPSHISAS